MLLLRWHKRMDDKMQQTTAHFTQLKSAFRGILPTVCLILVLPVLTFPEHVTSAVRHVLGIWVIILLAWFGLKLIAVVRDIVLSQYQLSAEDNLKARQIYTQMKVIQRVLAVVIIIFAIASILMTFERIRQIGVSILASAGIVGIIIGFAAQRSLATLFAGIQIAITQPIRIDDVVIVENEWGRIEEITLTYVVVAIWDQRRLIVPITHFIEKPFQNWTRETSELLGTVFIYADYSLPINELRAELERIVKDTPLWDGRLSKIQITNTTETTVEYRALVSAGNSSDAWELRCLAREKMIEFIRGNYPQSLPRTRIELDGENEGKIHQIQKSNND
ncbi:mechanosensitive ion channel [candidate division KSB1 bacterium]|nr:mechanosensitive ion channel [candidate division KSB1 bacterium]